MYELLVRSRWYALGWALFMAASTVRNTAPFSTGDTDEDLAAGPVSP